MAGGLGWPGEAALLDPDDARLQAVGIEGSRQQEIDGDVLVSDRARDAGAKAAAPAKEPRKRRGRAAPAA